MATDRKAIMVYVDKEVEDRIFNLRMKEEFRRCSKSEIIRTLLDVALDAFENEDEELDRKLNDVIRRELDRWEAEVCTPANEPGFIPEDSSGLKVPSGEPGVMGP